MSTPENSIKKSPWRKQAFNTIINPATTKKKPTNKESKVLVVGKEEEGANVPKNGAFNVVLGMTPSGGVLKRTK